MKAKHILMAIVLAATTAFDLIAGSASATAVIALGVNVLWLMEK